MPETTVEPRIKQRIVDVAMQRDRDFVTRWEGLVNALKSAIDILDQAPSPEKQGHLVPLIETYRWALGEFEAMTYGGHREIERLNAICTLLRNVSRNLPDA